MTHKKKVIIYFGGALPKEIENLISRVDRVPHIASQKFSWSVIRSLNKQFDTVYNISSCDILNYPSARKLFFSSQNFSRDNVDGFFIGFINLILLKHLTRMLALLIVTPVVILRLRAGYMLVHGSHTPFMLAALFSKWLFGVRIAILLTDQHGREVPSDGRWGRFLRSLDTSLMRALLLRFDAHVCLSEAFIAKYSLKNAYVVPGILNEKFKISIFKNNLSKPMMKNFNIVFAGGVVIENGIDSLLRAVHLIKNPNLRLFIYGAGALVGDVQAASRDDARIQYGGVLHGDELTKALLRASLLINPRPIGDEYAQTSFPSKLIEYMATGVPTLTTRLVSIPKELEDCLYFIDGDGPENIGRALDAVMNILPSDLHTRGRVAADRISNLYSESTFGHEVYALLH
jgi:glycosyltransferase involved in cell wall biosynthesis